MYSITLYRLYILARTGENKAHTYNTTANIQPRRMWIRFQWDLVGWQKASCSFVKLYFVLDLLLKNKILHRIVSKIWHAVTNQLRIPPLINLVILPPCFRERKIFTHFAQKILICWETLFEAHQVVFWSLHVPFFPFDLIINRKFQLAKKVVSESLGWWILLLG